MAQPPPPPALPSDTSSIVGSLRNPYVGQGSDNLKTPTIFNTSIDPVTYNGFEWAFSTGVSWGRFISGEPFIILPPAGVQVTGVTPGPTVVTGFTSEAGQAANSGITFYINGSMKNPVPWFVQPQLGFVSSSLGATVLHFVYDERLAPQGNKPFQLVVGGDMNTGVSMDYWLNFPVGISSGDVLVSAKSSFNPDWNLCSVEANDYVRWVNSNISNMCIEKFGILTALSASPTTSDCYRPPVFWNGASLADRPIFYRKDYVKQTENYIIEKPTKNIFNDDIDYNSTDIINEIYSWNEDVASLWNSTSIPYIGGTQTYVGTSAFDQYNENGMEFKSGYNGYICKIRDKMIQSIFVPWVSSANRLKARDKVVQKGIDCWGLINAKGIPNSNGGHGQGAHRPWTVFLGWIYGRNDIINYHNHPQAIARIGPGLTGNMSIENIKLPQDIIYKSLLSSEYNQRYLMSGSSVGVCAGCTGWVATNSNINLYHGLTSSSVSLSGNTGMGWIYKYTGISCAYSYVLPSVILSGGVSVSGSFGVIVAHKDFVGRLNALGNASGLSGPAVLPPLTTSTGHLIRRCFQNTFDTHTFWGFESGSCVGQNLKIVSGSGSGSTVYKIIGAENTFTKRSSPVIIDGSTPAIPPSSVNNFRYASFILDRDFQHGVPDETSQFMMYPLSDTEVKFGFDAESHLHVNNTAGAKASLLSMDSQPSYNNISDESILKNYSLHNHLGITSDQFLINYIKNVYFNENTPNYIRRQKSIGSAYVGEIFTTQNTLGGAVIGKMMGLTGNEFTPHGVCGICGSTDLSPSINMNGFDLEFTPEQITSYIVPFKSGKVYSGYGKVFSTPQTVLRITAIIDDKIFIDPSSSSLYDLGTSLRIQNGPFVTNVLYKTTNNELLEDQVLLYDFGDSRNNGNITISSKYVRNFPTFQEYAESGVLVKFNFLGNMYGMAGCAGILPNRGYTSKLASTFGGVSLVRTYEDALYLNLNQLNIMQIDLNSIWYCISSPRISAPGISIPLPMAEEYSLVNWKKPENVSLWGGGNIYIYPPTGSIPNGSQGVCYGTGTDDKLIFFRFLLNVDTNTIPTANLLFPSGTGSQVNNTSYPGWNTSDIFTKYRIKSMTIGNAANNPGYFTMTINGAYPSPNTTVDTDYRYSSYNTFRLYNNNLFEMESSFGLPAFNTFVQEGEIGNVSHQYIHSGFKYEDFVLIGESKFYDPQSSIMKIFIKDTGNCPTGFINTFIHGQTLGFNLPPVPHTLLWCTDPTS
jgi:hypothetical protein